MRPYSIVVNDRVADVIDRVRREDGRSITEVFVMAMEQLALSRGYVDRVEEVYVIGMSKRNMEGSSGNSV